MFTVVLLGIVSLLNDMASEMVFPLIPVYLTATLGATPAVLGVIEGIAESTASLLKVFSGYVSDRVGRRKPFVIFGYTAALIGRIFLFLSHGWPLVLAGRVADRFGKGTRDAPRDAVIAESSSVGKRGASFGLHRALDTLGAVFGVLLAYYFLTQAEGNFKKVFLLALIPSLAAVVLLLFLKEPKRISPELVEGIARPKLRLSWKALDTRLKIFLTLAFLLALGHFSKGFLLLRAANIGFSAGQVILLYLVFNISYFLFSYPAGRLSDAIGRRTILIFGYVIFAASYWAFAKVSDPTLLWAIFPFYGLFVGLTDGVERAFVSDLAPEHLKATSLGMHATLVGIGALPASIIAGALWTAFGPAVPFYFGMILGLLAAGGLWILISPRHPER